MPPMESTEADALVGHTLAGQFKILRRLGAGGMGAVYLAEQTGMERKVVVKVMHPELMLSSPSAVERFRREARAVAALNHPHIVQVHVFGQAEDGRMYLVMELVEGRDLAAILGVEGGLDQVRALRILGQISSALGEAHGRGIVHRDLKPENVMLGHRHGQPDWVKVLDFGIAKVGAAEGAALTQTGAIFGTPKYMAPEQVLDQPVDARTDLYALGIILYEMLTGSHPFTASSVVEYLFKHVNERVEPPGQLWPELALSPKVEAILLRLLEKAPADRFQSAAELEVAIQDALAGLGEAASTGPIAALAVAPRPVAPTVTAVPGSGPAPKPRHRTWLPWLLGGALVFAGGLVVELGEVKPSSGPEQAAAEPPTPSAPAPALASPASPDASDSPDTSAAPPEPRGTKAALLPDVADANEAVDLGPAGEAPSDIIEAPSPPAAKGDPIIIAAARKVLECKWSRDSPEYTCDAMKTWNDLDALEHGAGDTTLVALLTDPDERLQYLGAASLQAFSSYTTNRRLAERVLDRLETEEGGEELLRVLARAAAQISPTRTGLEARYKALPKKLTVPVAREEFIGKAQFSNSELMFDITLELARRDPSDLVRHAAVGAFWTGTPADRRDEVCELWLDTALDEKARRRLQTHAAYLAFSASTGCTPVFDRLLGHVSTKLAGSQDDLDWVNPLVYLAGNDKATAAQRAKATATLERIAADPASLDYVRARAMEGVIAGDPTGAKSYLSRMLGDPSERVKQAADRLLKKLASEPKKP